MSHALAAKSDTNDPLSGLYDRDDEQQRLSEILEQRYRAMLRAMHELVAAAFPDVENFRLTDSDVSRILLEAGRRIVGIDEVTRREIATMLRLGNELGLSSWEIANGNERLGYPGIEGLFKETWRGRPEMVARTEMQHAQIRSAVDRYQATGLVNQVELVDGEDDPECAARNGKIVPLEQVPGLAHPHCSLNVIPILREDV